MLATYFSTVFPKPFSISIVHCFRLYEIETLANEKYITQKIISVFEMVENIEGKNYQHFLLFKQRF